MTSLPLLFLAEGRHDDDELRSFGVRARTAASAAIRCTMASALKTIVSKKKRRFVEDGFNLDLSYISDRVIAMGFPAENIESLYRNSLDDVKCFLDQKHKGHYFIYNLCSERFYDPKKFNNRVANYPFEDHHPPDFSIIRPFCEDVDSWLAKHPKNVAVVHCKAGKGRTGVMICCYLLHIRSKATAEEVMSFYGKQRTTDHKGVTIPSQKRYIKYYADVVRNELEYKPVKMYLRALVLKPVPNLGAASSSEFYLQFEVKQNNGSVCHKSGDYCIKRGARRVQLLVEPPILLCGDIKVEFFLRIKLDMAGIKPKFMAPTKEFHFWFNTYFADDAFTSSLCHSVNNSDSSWRFAAGGVGDCAATSSLNSIEDDGLEPPRYEEADEIDLEDESSSSSVSTVIKNGKQNNATLAFSNSTPARAFREFRSATAHPLPVVRYVSNPAGSCHDDDGGDDDDNKDQDNGIRELNSATTNLLKLNSVSDDHLLQDRPAAIRSGGGGGGNSHRQHHNQHHVEFNNHHTIHATSSTSSCSSNSSAAAVFGVGSGAATITTTQSFIDRRTRHSSVPQTFKTSSSVGGGGSRGCSSTTVGVSYHAGPPPLPADIPGRPLSLHLEKPQIDKVFKDKQSKIYSEDFQVSAFLIRPNDQSDAASYSSSPSCLAPSEKQQPSSKRGHPRRPHSSPEESTSSEEEDTTDSEAVSATTTTSTTHQPPPPQQQQHHQQQQQPLFHQSEWV